MPRKKKDEAVVEAVEAETPVAPKSSSSDKVEVVDPTGFVARVYSLEEHGEDYKSLATTFAAKRGYTVR